MKTLKYVLFGAGGLLVLAIVAVAVFAMTFDPNRYKGQIETLVKEKTGRTLKLQGDLKVAIFPSLGADVSKVTLSERAADQEFLSLDSAHASVALLPLLHGEVIVDRVKVAGLKANIVKGKDGKFNFDDLLQSKDAKPAPESKDDKKGDAKSAVKFDIAGVGVERSAISYKDLASGQELALSDVKIATGRVSEKADGKLELAVTAKGRNPAIDMKVDLKGDYRVDLAAKSFAFAKVDGTVMGTLDKDTLEAKIAAPRIEITADKASGEAVTADFKLKGPQRSIEAALKLAGVQGSAKALVLSSISAQIALSGADMPKAFKVDVNGSARADLEKQTAGAELTSKVDESTIQSKLSLAKFSPPAYVFDINVDRLNLDQYFPPKPKAAAPAPAGKDAGKGEPSKQEDSPIDLSAIKDLNASGKIAFGALQVKGLKLANLKAEVKAANGRLDVSPHSASLYEGSLAGALSLQADGNHVVLKETLTNVSVGPLLRDVAQQDRVEGRGNVSLDVTGAGATVNTLKKSLDGTAKVNLKDGAIKGIDIGALLNKVKSLGGKSEEGSANSQDETKFTELNATFTIKNGVAHNTDLDMKAPLIRVGGAGDIDIGNSSLNYVVKGSVVASTKGQGGAAKDELAGLTVPVKLSGPFDAMKYQVDYSAAATDLAKSKVGERAKEVIEKNKDKVGDQVRDRLKGLLGR
jgi:AsmA protein